MWRWGDGEGWREGGGEGAGKGSWLKPCEKAALGSPVSISNAVVIRTYAGKENHKPHGGSRLQNMFSNAEKKFSV